jgi:hypothetical protein
MTQGGIACAGLEITSQRSRQDSRSDSSSTAECRRAESLDGENDVVRIQKAGKTPAAQRAATLSKRCKREGIESAGGALRERWQPDV